MLTKEEYKQAFGREAFRRTYPAYVRAVENRQKHKSYKEYIKSKEWFILKEIAVKNAKGRCQLCNTNYRIEVHHRTYERLFNEKLSDLTVLCKDCHSSFHIKHISFDDVLTRLERANGKA